MIDKKQQEKDRSAFAQLLSGVKDALSRKQDELDKEGIERKELTPEMVDDVTLQLGEKLPELSEEMTATILEIVVEAFATTEPTDVVEEEGMVEGEEGKADEEEVEVDDEKVRRLETDIAEMGKAYTDLISDVSEVMTITQKAVEQLGAGTKSYDDFSARLGKIEKQLAEKPRRASQAPETEVDPESELGKSIKGQAKTVPEGYEAFADMFKETS